MLKVLASDLGYDNFLIIWQANPTTYKERQDYLSSKTRICSHVLQSSLHLPQLSGKYIDIL
jgi:hypothetical protein